MLLEHEGDYGLGMDVKVTVCSWKTQEIMVWAWGCRGNRMLLEHEGDYTKEIMVWAWMQW